MAEALARGFVDKKVIEPSDIWCCDPSKSRMDVFTDFGASAVKNGAEVWAADQAYLHISCTCFHFLAVTCCTWLGIIDTNLCGCYRLLRTSTSSSSLSSHSMLQQ